MGPVTRRRIGVILAIPKAGENGTELTSMQFLLKLSIFIPSTKTFEIF